MSSGPSRHDIMVMLRMSRHLNDMALDAAGVRGLNRSEFIRYAIRVVSEDTLGVDASDMPVMAYKHPEESE